MPVGQRRKRLIVCLNYDPGDVSHGISLSGSTYESHLAETLERVFGQLVPLAVAVVRDVRFPWEPEEIYIEADVVPIHEIRASLRIRWVADLRFNRAYELVECHTDRGSPALTEDIRRIYALLRPADAEPGPKP